MKRYVSVGYLVTEDFSRVESPGVFLGNYPGLRLRERDLHFISRFPEWEKILIDKMPFPGSVSILEEKIGSLPIGSHYTIAAPNVDCDVIAAAAWLQLRGDQISPEVRDRLRAIAFCCKRFFIPVAEQGLQRYWRFAMRAVNALRESTFSVWDEISIPYDPSVWDETQRMMHNSVVFQYGVGWLLDAIAGYRPWPGEE